MSQTSALDPDLVELVKALARANAARDIARARQGRDSADARSFRS